MRDKDSMMAKQEKERDERPPSGVVSERLLKERIIVLSGEVNKPLAARIVSQLLYLDVESKDPIHVYIDTPGGDVNAGFAIFDMMRMVNSPVYTIGMGLVASAGALILLAAGRERRLGLENSHYMLHQPLSGMSGVASDIEIHAREIERLRHRINAIISQECGKAVKQVEKDTDRDFWLNAEESLKYGLISRVVSKRSDIK